MKLGVGTYAYMWSIGFLGAQPDHPLDALGLLRKARELEVDVVQFGPNLPLDRLTASQLHTIVEFARDAQIDLELGTRGIETSHLRHQLDLAEKLGSTLLRSVPELPSGESPSRVQLSKYLEGILPELESRRIRLAFENGGIPAQELASLLDEFHHPWLGVTLDTVNSLAIPEGTRQVVKALARHTMCFHVKDFVVRRAWHMMGFVVEGTAAGQGQMDFPWILEELRASGAAPNAILELWPPEQKDLQATIALEQKWAEQSIQYLRPYIPRKSLVATKG